MMFPKVLIANRGAIACRIARTLRRMEIGSVALYSEIDRASLHVRQADEAVCIGGPRGYLDMDAVIAAAVTAGAGAIHPGYGFLSENASFAEACRDAGIAFIGPTPDQLRDFGLKHRAREIAAQCAVTMLPGTGLLTRPEDAAAIGFPLMLKSTAGGGGIGLRVCRSADELFEAFAAIERLSSANFKDSGVFAERFVERARHIEVQIFGDGKGRVVALGERDCSAQRRNQKVIEETPAAGLSEDTRAALHSAAVRLGEAVSYQNAGTVEFLYDDATGEFYFLEVNTRLQVEHGVTEEVTGVDIVEWMVRLAAGEDPIRSVTPTGASIQVRVYAESPLKEFQPCAGTLSHAVFPGGARVETWVESGSAISTFYDPLLAKIIVTGKTRDEAVRLLNEALQATTLYGIETNLDYLRGVCSSPAFHAGGFSTSLLREFNYITRAIEVLEPGTQSTIQDYPGRLGYWHIGVPPSGPMDDLAHRMANEIAGNPIDAAAIEMSLIGPALMFHHDAIIALTGADMGLPRWQPIAVQAGETLRFSAVQGPGARAYLAIRGGIEAAGYLGSRSTFILGKFGGGQLRSGDLLRFGTAPDTDLAPCMNPPVYASQWTIGVNYGPHGAPDFFTPGGIETFFATNWRVHYNSDRTGVRLLGPKPEWARKDGGEAGLHPSNIHDNAYAVGTVDFTGDMPIILGPDGPSCGGFVCPATIVASERWKMGQLKAGDTVRFVRVNDEPAILRGEAPGVVIRNDGDRNLLVEFGDNRLDFELSLAAHSLRRQLAGTPGIVDLTPGIRSLQIHFNPARISREELYERIDGAQAHPVHTVPSRTVHLPLSWDDPQTRLAIEKYMQGVRPDAPWCPSNLEFIRRINGLKSVDDVYRIVFDASWLTLALGDVYLGAPVATPLDPRHRLVTTKYNPARTWTPENAVGIGGAYLCVYGMEGPGGYQFVGRTTQMWKTHRGDKPWLLDYFDRLQFYPVTASELLELRADPAFTPRIEDGEFSLAGHQRFLASIAGEADAFQRTREQAFREERDRWGEYIAPALDDVPPVSDDKLPDGATAVRSPISGSVWAIPVETGQRVASGERMLVLEAMKMELAVTAPLGGEVLELPLRARRNRSTGSDSGGGAMTPPVWIRSIPEKAPVQGPLAGLTFAIKDNIDYAGVPTTAGCPAFAYTPKTTAPVVAALEAAGARAAGKTNLDQFATGLVGVRSPFGACASVFNKEYISGGSSSGSAVAVASGQVDFSLGTDTAGSGRVPAAFNNILGLKPTRGILSTDGVVPACACLDCVSIFTRDAATASRVFSVLAPRGPLPAWAAGPFRFGVLAPEQREFFNDAEAAALYQDSIARLIAIGGAAVEIDYTPFRDAAALLYSGPWVAERFAAVGEFIASNPDAVHPVVRNIILGGANYSAVDVFRAQYRLEALRKQTAPVRNSIDFLCLPTTGTTYKIAEVEADPVRLNSNLGYYTNFVNLLDLAAIAIPAGFRSTGLPFGISLVGPANSDWPLLEIASRAEEVRVAVVGAHLTGQPLNRQLTDRGARLVRSCKTAPNYRLFALANTTPPKPGLVREESFKGPGIEVEVWSMPARNFGSFVALVAAPLGIGSVFLEDGVREMGFICEPAGLVGATEITRFGGWRNWRSSGA